MNKSQEQYKDYILKEIDKRIDELKKKDKSGLKTLINLRGMVLNFKAKQNKKPLEDVWLEASVLIEDIHKRNEFFIWLKYRRDIRKTVRAVVTLNRLAIKFDETDLEVVKQTVNHSIENQYQGLFWDKFKSNGTTTTKADKATTWFNT